MAENPKALRFPGRELPKCGRMVVLDNGNYYRCRERVVSPVIACPNCAERETANL